MSADISDNLDAGVDDEIFSYLNPEAPRRFFLYAGAGSGKTRSLVKAIDKFRTEHRRKFALNGRRIGVITYTNAACDEIKQRLDFDALVEVSTIHAFAWTLIGNYHSDIKAWLRTEIATKLEELQVAQAKGRAGTQAARKREQDIQRNQRRLAELPNIKKFIYSPTGDNRTRDSLNHAEVIKIAADFLTTKPALQQILINGFPILFIDESQDTLKILMEAFLVVQATHRQSFCLGLFGDTMQRIYADGKVGLGEDLPPDWAKPVKRMNWRCPERVIRLINKIRSAVDGQTQVGKKNNPDGTVRLFVVPQNLSDKSAVEAKVSARMADLSQDTGWNEDDGVKALILEHHMAATRMGFDVMFDALRKVPSYDTGLLDGSLPGLRFFAETVLPMVNALKAGNRFAVAAIAREKCPTLDKKYLLRLRMEKLPDVPVSESPTKEEQKRALLDVQLKQLAVVKAATESLLLLWGGEREPTFDEVLQEVARTNLFEVPDSLRFAVADAEPAPQEPVGEEAESEEDAGETESQRERRNAWQAVLQSNFSQIEGYSAYVQQKAKFGTHQGVKGLEFPRVMVIVDDEAARGFLFSYDKLFGVKEKSETDIKNEQAGNETSADRTRRLFYVTCSRAESSLAIVAYANDPAGVKANAIAEGWFDESEIELIQS
ncbi:MAG: UvrD-helicase domain-containing protein [Ferrovibrio sp.]|uniref:UvrD-helicase domain-containing protein n=1 Tax=Ferrovibrio sp. TaxID=1917215 RepID=UPI003919586B